MFDLALRKGFQTNLDPNLEGERNTIYTGQENIEMVMVAIPLEECEDQEEMKEIDASKGLDQFNNNNRVKEMVQDSEPLDDDSNLFDRFTLCFTCRYSTLHKLEEKRILALTRPSFETYLYYYHYMITALLVTCIYVSTSISLNLPWFTGIVSLNLSMNQGNGEPYHAKINEYVTHYTADVLEAPISVTGDYTEFPDKTQAVIDTALLAVEIQKILSIILLVKIMTFGCITFARRLREKKLESGTKTWIFGLFSTENPSPNSWNGILENCVWKMSISPTCRAMKAALFIGFTLFEIVTIFFMYPVQLYRQTSRPDEYPIPEGSRMNMVNIEPGDLSVASGWWLYISTLPVWIVAFIFYYKNATISRTTLSYIEHLHKPWKMGTSTVFCCLHFDACCRLRKDNGAEKSSQTENAIVSHEERD